MHLTDAEVRQEIRDAWANSIRPSNEEIVVQHWGEYAYCLEKLASRNWQDITRDEVMHIRACFRFISIRALCYFIPAYLIASIDERSTLSFDWDITEYTLHALTRLKNDPAMVLSMQQQQAIKHYLHLIGQQDLAKEAAADIAACLRLFEEP